MMGFFFLSYLWENCDGLWVMFQKFSLTVFSDVKYLKEEDANRKTFTVSSTLDFRVDRSDDGVAVICRVDHESLNATPQVAMQVLEIHCK